MALQENFGGGVSLPAAADLSAKQYFAIKVNSSGQAAVAGAGEAAIGILQDNNGDAAGKIVNVAPFTGRKMKAYAGGTITAGQNVTADAAGELVAATTGNFIYGVALESAVDGDIFQFLAVAMGVSD
jgi:hypothetical protein